MPKPELEVCGRCRFEVGGECRRYAPMVSAVGNVNGDAARAVWPKVAASDWCGDYEDDPALAKVMG